MFSLLAFGRGLLLVRRRHLIRVSLFRKGSGITRVSTRVGCVRSCSFLCHASRVNNPNLVLLHFLLFSFRTYACRPNYSRIGCKYSYVFAWNQTHKIRIGHLVIIG